MSTTTTSSTDEKNSEELQRRLDSINAKLPSCISTEEREQLAREARSLAERLNKRKKSASSSSLSDATEQQTPGGSQKQRGGQRQQQQLLSDIPKVKIAPEGTFKYVLIKVDRKKHSELPGDDDDIYFVRGHADARYHYQCASKLTQKLEGRGIPCDVTGGGRILHEPEKKEVKVYGFSYQYGQAEHAITSRLIQEHYGKGYSVSWSNEGY